VSWTSLLCSHRSWLRVHYREVYQPVRAAGEKSTYQCSPFFLKNEKMNWLRFIDNISRNPKVLEYSTGKTRGDSVCSARAPTTSHFWGHPFLTSLFDHDPDNCHCSPKVDVHWRVSSTLLFFLEYFPPTVSPFFLTV